MLKKWFPQMENFSGQDVYKRQAWYWVLGNITSEDGIYAYENTLKNIEAKPYNELAGGSTVDTVSYTHLRP